MLHQRNDRQRLSISARVDAEALKLSNGDYANHMKMKAKRELGFAYADAYAKETVLWVYIDRNGLLQHHDKEQDNPNITLLYKEFRYEL